jgi:hypothetical protein
MGRVKSPHLQTSCAVFELNVIVNFLTNSGYILCPGDHHDARRILLDEFTSECDKQRDEKLKDIAESLTRPRCRRNNQSRSTTAAVNSVYQTKPTRDGEYSEEEQKKGFDRTDSPIISQADHIAGGGDKLVRIYCIVFFKLITI